MPGPPLGVRGHKGNAYDVPPTCSHPTCARPAQHVHHCWPRSFLRKQPVEWVRYEDDTVVGNRLGFCVEHHEMLTGEIGGYRARLRWEGGVMWWEDRAMRANAHHHPGGGPEQDTFWNRALPTKHQPPIVMDNGDIRVRHDIVEGHSHASAEEESQCPTCGHVKRKAGRDEPKPGKTTPLGKRREYAMSSLDPEAHDEFVNDFAIPLGFDHLSQKVKRDAVYTLVEAWMLTQRSDFIADVAASAGRRLSS